MRYRSPAVRPPVVVRTCGKGSYCGSGGVKLNPCATSALLTASIPRVGRSGVVSSGPARAGRTHAQ